MPSNRIKDTGNTLQANNSYKRVLKTTALVGGASVITIFCRLIRGKFFALFVGPYGVGLIGMFNATINISVLFCSLGLPSSVVRQISSARGFKDSQDIELTIKALMFIIPLLSLTGGSLIWLLQDTISLLIFKNTKYSQEIGWLGLAVVFMIGSNAVVAILQGYQKMMALSSAEVVSAITASALGIIIVFFSGTEGIVFALVTIAFVKFSVNLIYVLRLPIYAANVSIKHVFKKSITILQFGGLFMLASALIAIAHFIIRIMITREFGINFAGYFHAAHAISVTYVALLFQAMSRDYYPNLTRHISDNKLMVKLVNEQAHVALVIGAPFIILLMTFSPLVLTLLYTESFLPAENLLRCLILRLPFSFISYPMGFVILAKGRAGLYFFTQLPTNVILVVCSLFAMNLIGITGAGIGFVCADAVRFLINGFIITRLIGFKTAPRNMLLLLTLFGSATGVFVLSYYSIYLSFGVGMVISSFYLLFSWHELSRITGLSPYNWFIKKIRAK